MVPLGAPSICPPRSGYLCGAGFGPRVREEYVSVIGRGKKRDVLKDSAHVLGGRQHGLQAEAPESRAAAAVSPFLPGNLSLCS